MTIFAAENVRDWRGKPVIDPSGARIGELEAVYGDTASDGPAFATMKIGMIGRHRLVFVPLVGASVRPDALRVQFDKKLVGDGPSIDTDGELSADAEPEGFSHYGMPAGNNGVRRLARR
jgi:PRC-barrel domain protein